MGAEDMVNAEPLNLIWFVVDSVRNYRSGGDDRDKLDLMYKMAGECVDFQTVVTSAPSTVMSGSTMMTGCPSYLIGRDYDNFTYDQSAFTSLGEILKKRGYFTAGMMWFLHSRQTLGDKAIDLEDRRFWPKGLKFGRSWTNNEVSQILNNRLDAGLRQPFFLLVWYNCRGDPQTSEKVERDVERLKEMDLFDHSMFLLSSDHGYPDPSRGMGPQWFARQGLTHDLVITDDNILVPLLVRYPGCQPRKVTTPVSTMDLMPTILDVLGISLIPEESSRIQGQSLVPLMEGKSAPHLEDRKFRSDARFMMQSHRRTAIRGTSYKYVAYHDEEKEEFYDLDKDPSESRNLIAVPDLSETIDEYRREFQRSEEEAVNFHVRYLLERTEGLDTDLTACRTALVIYNQAIPNGELILGALSSLFDQAQVELLTSQPVANERLTGFSRVIQCEPPLGSGGSLAVSELAEEAYDVVIVPTVERRSVECNVALALGRRLGRRYPLIIDTNLMSIGERRMSLTYVLKVANQRKGLYVREPELILRDLRNALSRITGGRIRKAKGSAAA